MADSSDKPAPGSRSESASALRDAVGAAAGLATAAVSVTRDQFVKRAAIANLYEIEAAKIALQRAQRKSVKDFAEALLADHEKMGSELRSFLGGTNSPQMPPDSLDTVHQTMLDDLHGAADDDFDKRYITQQKLAHQEAITLFNAYRRMGSDGGLTNLAGLALPVLQKHLDAARRLDRTP